MRTHIFVLVYLAKLCCYCCCCFVLMYTYIYIYRFKLKCVIFCIFQLPPWSSFHLVMCFFYYLYFSGLDTRDLFSTIRNKFQFQFLNKYSSNWMRAAKIRNIYVYYTYISLNFYFMLWNGMEIFKNIFFSFKSCHRVFIGLLGKKNERKMRNFL